MGFKEAFKKLGEKLQEAVDTASKNLKYNSKLRETKIEILMKFKMDDLKRICKVRGISTKKTVSDPDDVFTLKQIEITRKDELAKRIAGKLSLEEVIRYAKRHGIEYRDELEELKEFERELFGAEEKQEEDYIPREEIKEGVEEEMEEYEEEAEEEKIATKRVKRVKDDFEELLSTIRDQFKPETVRNEEDLEKQLYQFLQGKLSGRKIERQV
ncbi:MAG: hypothetical protein PWQ22_1553 [Archaeoglobaceae archaeon]|nr:hypothetical protein [Archaeoglobaceae archaeon]